MSYSVGECKYCGQLVQVDEPYDTMEEAKEAAFAFCDCAGARAERRTLDQINNATEKIREIFGKVGEKAAFQAQIRMCLKCCLRRRSFARAGIWRRYPCR